MGVKIALAGKGGTGKTTISALIIRSIIAVSYTHLDVYKRQDE